MKLFLLAAGSSIQSRWSRCAGTIYPGALRLLADHLDRQEISASLWNFQGNSMVQDWRREHFLMTLDMAVLPSRAGK